MTRYLVQPKLLQKESLKKTAEATDDLIGNKIADKITRVSEISPKINSETNEEEYISPELKKNVDDLRLRDGRF